MRTKSCSKKSDLMKRRVIRVCFLITVIVSVFFVILAGAKSIQATESKTASKLYTSITINPGDSLWSIASEYIDGHYSSMQDYINELMLINNLTSDLINADEHLLVPYYVS